MILSIFIDCQKFPPLKNRIDFYFWTAETFANQSESWIIPLSAIRFKLFEF